MELNNLDRARFWARVNRDNEHNGCWPWEGAPNADGYGRFTVRGVRDYAHRWAFRMSHGPIPSGAVVRHRCHNPICVRPEHLEAGTHADNMGDMVLADRHGRAKLTKQKARQILREWAAPDRPNQQELAERHGVTRTAVTKLVGGRTWKVLRERPDE